MSVKIFGLIVVLVSGICAFFARKILELITKRDISDREVVMFKAAALIAVIVGACGVFFADRF